MQISTTKMDLIALLKVFDVNFATEDDFAAVTGLDPNRSHDLAEAATKLLKPEFDFMSSVNQGQLAGQLRFCLQDASENFDDLFSEIELIFEQEVSDHRYFMKTLLESIEGWASCN